MSKEQRVIVKSSMFGFLEGEEYIGVKTAGGWKVATEDGDWIMLPEAAVEAPTRTAAETVAGPPPKKRGRPKKREGTVIPPIEVKAVETDISAAEQSALERAIAGGENFGSQKGNEKPSILGAILAGEQLEPVKPSEPMTPQELVAMGKQDDLMRRRKKLIPPSQPLLQEYQCWLTDLTDGVLPKSGVDHIITCYPPAFWPEQLQKDIPEFDIFHEWDADVLESIYLAHVDNEKGLFVGYPGTGKSTSHRNYAGLIRQPFMRLNGKDGIDASSFIGFLWAGANGTEFAEGLLPVAMRHGYYLVIDEVFKIPPEIQMNFQTVYEEDGFLLLDEKPGTLSDKLVVPHPEFRLMGTDNAKGTGDDFEKFGATQTQDTSTLDRFGVTANVPYLKQDKEVATLCRLYPDMEEESLQRLVRVANLIRENYRQNSISLTLSMRGLKVMCKFIRRGLSEDSVYRKVYHDKLSNQDEIETSEQHVRAVGLSQELPIKAPSQTTGFTGSAKEYVEGKEEIYSAAPWEGDNAPF